MKLDLYSKIVLTVIAICLTINVLKDFDIMPKAYGSETKPNIENKSNLLSNKNYGLIPVNADGTIDVNIKSSSVMDVNITEVNGGYVSYGKLPVVIKQNDDK